MAPQLVPPADRLRSSVSLAVRFLHSVVRVGRPVDLHDLESPSIKGDAALPPKNRAPVANTRRTRGTDTASTNAVASAWPASLPAVRETSRSQTKTFAGTITPGIPSVTRVDGASVWAAPDRPVAAVVTFDPYNTMTPATLRWPQRLDGLSAALPGADPDDLLYIHHPHLAVADLSGPRCGDKRLDDVRSVVVVCQNLHADLRHEVDLVLRASVHLGVAALASVALSV